MSRWDDEAGADAASGVARVMWLTRRCGGDLTTTTAAAAAAEVKRRANRRLENLSGAAHSTRSTAVTNRRTHAADYHRPARPSTAADLRPAAPGPRECPAERCRPRRCVSITISSLSTAPSLAAVCGHIVKVLLSRRIRHGTVLYGAARRRFHAKFTPYVAVRHSRRCTCCVAPDPV